ncbi:hypothetical protein [Sodalis-like endosymbiont of Proechinophthirus fluctus]|uniref:hypothetical protein n=1 Tax=Sodalis-like endosymbiont of Proechinophthirus fluctus TaxID=1462730 RepID=UPI001650197B|nr:hypothetical protein [Sodalis-like endosymbiont of Proechinophthirus fluctus]
MRALVKRPVPLIFDETLQGLDLLNRRLVRRWIEVLIGQGTPAIVIRFPSC